VPRLSDYFPEEGPPNLSNYFPGETAMDMNYINEWEGQYAPTK
jgi:hypothetical protein